MKFNNIRKTKIISGFPGVGKSTLFRSNSALKILDSDSSTFDKANFPKNYMCHIKENIGKVDIIMVSSHDVVRQALVDEDIDFVLVYPDISLKQEYKDRYIKRGSPDAFINLLDNMWKTWISGCINQNDCMHIVLKEGVYLDCILDENISRYKFTRMNGNGYSVSTL